MGYKLNLNYLLENINGIAYRCKNDDQWTMEFITQGVETITGYSADNFIENKVISLSDLILKEDADQLRQTVQTALDSRSTFELTYRIKNKDGEILYLWEQGLGIYNDNNELEALEGYICDVTLQQHTQIELEEKVEKLAEELFRRKEQEKDKAQFDQLLEVIKGMAHELKNPLTLSLNSFSILKIIIDENAATDLNHEKTTKLISIIQNANSRINQIIDTIASIFKNASRERALYSLQQLIKESIEGIHNNPVKITEKIQFDIEDLTQFNLQVTEPNFSRSVTHLLNNSIFATEQKKRVEGHELRSIKISAEINNWTKELHLKIYDNGIGISKKNLDKIRLPFFSTRSRGTSGGFGLTTSLYLLHKDDIEIEFQSEENNWTQVILKIPKNRWGMI